MKYKFEAGEYLTRSGKNAVVVTDSAAGAPYPLVGFIEYADGQYSRESWTPTGVYNTCTDLFDDNDLMPPKTWSLGNTAWCDDDEGQWVKRGNMCAFFMTQCSPAIAAEVVALLNKGEAA
jgi:hypothetical protein